MVPALAAVAALGAVLRCLGVDKSSLWIDEYASLVVARHPLADIPSAALAGNAFEPPIYFWALHLMIVLLGESEAALRALSVAAGTLSIPAAALLFRALGASARTTAVGALLLACNPLHLWYSQEARPYAVAVLFGVLALLALAYALRGNSWPSWIGFGVLGALSVLTHATAIVVPVIGVIWVLLHRGAAVPGRFWTAVFVTAAGVTPFVIALSQASAGGNGTGSPPRQLTGLEVPYTLFTYVAGYSFGPPVRAIQDLGPTAAVLEYPVQTGLAVLGLLLAGFAMIGLRGRLVLALLVLCAVPLAAAFGGSLVTGKAYNVRYALIGLVGFIGLSAAAGAPGRPLRHAAVPVLLLIGLAADLQWMLQPRYWKDDSRAAAACLGHELDRGGTVAVTPAYVRDLLAHYAARQGAGAALKFQGVESEEDPLLETADALLVTRRHHVPRVQAIAAAFASANRGAAIPPRSVTGYQILFRDSSGDRVGSACRGPE